MNAPARPTPIVSHLERYIGGDTPSEIFSKLVGGDNTASTVYNALETAAKRYEGIADDMRGLATAAAEGDTSEGPLHMLAAMAVTFDKQEADVRKVLAYLRGDDEPEQPF